VEGFVNSFSCTRISQDFNIAIFIKLFNLESFQGIDHYGEFMTKICTADLPNLKDIPFTQALTIAYSLTPLTYEQIAERMGKGHETIHRLFTDPSAFTQKSLSS